MTARAARGANRSLAIKRTAVIRRLDDPREIRRYLYTAPAYSAFAAAYLDPSLSNLADFYLASEGNSFGLVMHARGGAGTTSVTFGEPALVEALLRLHPGPRQSFLTCQTDHVDTLLTSHNLWRPQTMLRMQLDREAFKLNIPPTSNVRRLTYQDADELNRLYAIEEEGLHYTGRQVHEGIYYGAYSRGRLVAAAGTHIASRAEGAAVIGNVFTHPDFRGHGHGTAVTSAVAAHLTQACENIVLNVDPANRTARHIYEQMGFLETGRLVEAMATRRNNSAFVPLMRRAVGRWRASAPGTELADL